jgi:type IV pilus assembly protein PilN
MIFFLLLVLNVLKFIFNEKLSVLQEEIAVLQSQLFDVEQLQAQQAKLQNALADMQRLVTQRSNAAELLEEISRRMPEGVWLQEIVAAPLDTARMNETGNRVQLRGWAFDEGKIAKLLEQLESSAHFSDVRLLITSRLPASEVWKRTKVKKVDLVQFTIVSVSVAN